jgi:phosphohistidine phosphatase
VHLLIIRHGIAEDREDFARTGEADELRPLTAKGRERMRRAAVGLKRIAQIDLLAHSPLVRAVQTAKILDAAFPTAAMAEIPELRPGQGPEQVAHWLSFVSREATVALVGHEPDLGELAAWLTTGATRPFMQLKKGGAIMLECTGRPGPATASLIWALGPRQLRLLAATK